MKRILTIILLFSSFCSFSQGDCATLVTICADALATCVNGTNDGEITAANRGCLSSGEDPNQSYWYRVCVSGAGTLRFVINPAGGGNDYDFAVWGPNVTCGALGAPVRCSYASGGGNTGVHSPNNAPQTDNSEGATGNKWVQNINALANECYIVCVINYGGGSNSFNFNMSGTATYTCTPLPISLLEFNGEKEGTGVRLKWATATEVNNDYFTIEKSLDAVHFDYLSSVDGSGNSTQIVQYSDLDSHPAIGTNYYRLKQTDFNGEYSYSSVIEVNFISHEAFISNLHPNPVQGDDIFFNFYSPQYGVITIEVVDCLGRIVLKQMRAVNEGISDLSISLQQLPPGMYSLKIDDVRTGHISSSKIIRN